MARRLPPLNAVRAFEAAARHVSLSRAAAELHVTHGAISHQIKSLEADLGVRLVERAGRENYEVHLTWGKAREQARAEELARGHRHVVLVGKLSLLGMARELASAAGVVAVDTGLCHLAAALAVPTLSLYGATSAGLTGAYGLSQHYLSADFPCAPCIRKRCSYTGPRQVEPACFEAMTPERVWEQFQKILGGQSLDGSAPSRNHPARAVVA